MRSDAAGWELAQVNIARLLEPLDSARLADFVGALGPVNALADAAPGFRWRLQDDDGDATAIQAFTWDAGTSCGVIVNLTVWASIEALADFSFSGPHREVLRRRREWFQPMGEAYLALWWIPAGERPTTADAEERVQHLREHGPTPWAFTMREHFPPPSLPPGPLLGPLLGEESWRCPV